jgi:hypothetical protein
MEIQARKYKFGLGKDKNISRPLKTDRKRL